MRQLFDKKMSSSSHHFILNILFRSLNDRVEPFLVNSMTLIFWFKSELELFSFKNEINFKFDTQLPKLDEADVSGIELELINQLSSLKSSSFSSSTSSSSTSASSTSSASACTPQLENSAPMFESPQNSQKTSETTQTQSITKTSSKLSKFSENFLAELNADELKMDLKNDQDLCLLNSLSEMLTNKYEAQQELNKPAVDPEEIAKIKIKLSEAKSMLASYLNDFKQDISYLSTTQVQIARTLSEISVKSKKVEQENKAVFFTDLLAFLNLDNDQRVWDEFLSKQTDSLNKEFAQGLFQIVEKWQSSNQKQIESLKVAINQAKKNNNADKQIQFNEAIKRATQEKDKTIEELRLKEAAYLQKIDELKQSLEKVTELNQAANLVINSNTVESKIEER